VNYINSLNNYEVSPLAFNLADCETFWSEEKSYVKLLSVDKIMNTDRNFLSSNTEQGPLSLTLALRNATVLNSY
jgi:hypothetical protein